MKKIVLILLIGLTFACQTQEKENSNVITTDIDNFWTAYDLIVQETDTMKQISLIDSLYIHKGTIGLEKIMEVRNYTSNEYVHLINHYPQFWESIRTNTYKSKTLANELNSGVAKLKAIYQDLKPAKIYFTIGCMRTNGTTRDSLVLIGSELAMADSTTTISEFEGRTKEWLKTFFASNPIENLVLLNVHEYVHTQQNPISNTLLHQVLYEGIAEFVSVTAMGVPSATPAVAFGKNNPAVGEIFEKEMFYERTYEWLWSDAPNAFEVRDLGYYIGYAIAELHYEKASDKAKAIEEMIRLDYTNSERIDKFIDNTGYFSKPIDFLRQEDKKRRAHVTRLIEFENGARNVDPKTRYITLEFSEKLNGYNTGVDFSDIGEEGFPTISNRFWSADSTSWTLEVDLEPEKHYKFWITSNFRTEADIPILPYMIEFVTRKE